jgi:predicted ATPase
MTTKRFALKSVRVQNLKAIKDSGLVELTPLTVFIGNNGAGKSSLIEALVAYREVVGHGLDNAFDRWHGLDYVVNKQPSRRQRTDFILERAPVTFHWGGTWGRSAFQVKIWIGLEEGGNAGRIQKELLKLPGGRRYQRSADGKCESFNDTTMERVRRVLPGESAAPQDWVQLAQRWQFLALEPRPMGEPARQAMSGGPPVLQPDGSNLAQYLWSLRNASVEAFEGLLGSLQIVLPYARDVQPVISEAIDRLVHVEMTEESFKVPGWLLSTGTLRILALLACLRHPDPPPLLVVEEIENGLDPRTLQLLVSEIQEAINAGRTQVILTTHSPYLLDLLDLSHIVVVERESDGPTFRPTFRRPGDEKELRDWARDFSPGRLYTMGRLTRGE